MRKHTLLLTAGLTILLAGCTKAQPQPEMQSQAQEQQQVQLEYLSTPVAYEVTPPPSAVPVVSTQPTQEQRKVPMATSAVISTSKGDIELELFQDKAPKAVENFATKAANGFYKNLTFHRVEDWVIQGGDPLGNGTGGGKMATELNQEPFVAGSLGVARGMDINISNDAQFFICTTDCRWLDGQYTNFGKVTKGMDVVKNIQIGDKILSITTK